MQASVTGWSNMDRRGNDLADDEIEYKLIIRAKDGTPDGEALWAAGRNRGELTLIRGVDAEALAVLRDLVILKRFKDREGTTDEYKANRVAAWARAEKVVAKLLPITSCPDSEPAAPGVEA